MQRLKDRTKSLILLSATPMQIDPIEIFDLLNLLGLEGHWSYGENFCNYFFSLSDNPDSHTLDLWQTMSNDYFRRGGTECDRLEEYLVNGERIMAYKLRNIWKQGKSIVNPKKLAQDTSFINASRQYLTVNTPLKDLMFRHTRDTLRQYYKLGILDKDIPKRIVSDNTEPVDPKEIEYLEDLLRQFENTGEDSKLSHFLTILRQELSQRESAIVFTQYTDTMDYLRENLQQLYGSQVACYSGRGGELYQDGEWQRLPKEEIKKQFKEGIIKILLCTESASEGLNLQTCGILINYDLP